MRELSNKTYFIFLYGIHIQHFYIFYRNCALILLHPLGTFHLSNDGEITDIVLDKFLYKS